VPDSNDVAFVGSVAELYDRHLVPLIFEAYADDLVSRLAPLRPRRALEIAAGTGVVTRRLAKALDAELVATDLNPPMLEWAQRIGTPRPVEWRQADAMKLPFADASFDAVVCQFGVMFFPDRGVAFAEARRVLRPGGVFLFNSWDAIERNELGEIVSDAVAALFPKDPPGFLRRTPYAYHQESRILADLAAGGFAPAPIETIAARSRCATADAPAIGFCQGSPLRGEIEARGPGRLQEATAAATEAVAARFGRGPIDAAMSAIVVTARND
jgi:SAM-dependent methyltransferase